MTPRTRKLLTAAALATAFIAGPAAAHQGAGSTAPAAAEAAAAPAPAAEAAPDPDATVREARGRLAREARRNRVASAVKGIQTVVHAISNPDDTACRIGNGKGSMYSDNLWSCVVSVGQGEYVVLVPRRGSR